MMNSQTNIQETLQAEFCPPLDTSLVAAFLGEYSATDGKQLSAADLSELRQTLSALASQAEHQALADSFSPTNSDEPAPSIADSSSVHTPDLSHDTSSASASLSSSDFVGSPTSFNSPLGFLQAAFPDVDTKRLRNALAAHGEGADADMETIVSTILSSEYIRELEERGLDDDDSARTRAAEEAPWITAKSGHKTNTPKAPKKAKGRTFTIVDVRQSQHAHKEPARRTTTAGRPAPDPWIQMNSLSTRLADLIPSRPASFFLSLFHNPSYGTFTNAIRAGLATIAASSDTLQTNEDQPALFMLFELLSNSEEYSKLDSEQRATLFSDAQLAFQATNGLPDEALDIVLLLHDLDDDDSGVSHAPPTPISPASTSFASIAGSPKLPASSSVHSFATPSPASPVQTRASTDGWQHIPERRAPRGPNPHTQFIPAYDPLRGSRKLRGMGNGLGKGGKGDVGELVRGGEEREAERAKRRVAELMESRDAALRDATRAWQRGNAKSHGGEVAMFFAERARKLGERAKAESLIVAREMVHNRRTSQSSSVDLHNTTAAEAVAIIKEILATEGCSQANPLSIITGKGRHSVNGVSVLRPAVRSALIADGWNVSTYDSGLVVRGKMPGR